VSNILKEGVDPNGQLVAIAFKVGFVLQTVSPSILTIV
jgi:hypothetical protein